MRVSGKLKYIFLGLLLALSLIPSTFAATGISPLDSAIGTVSTLFNIQVLRDNPVVREGFMRLMLFIVLFAVFNAVLKRMGGIFDNKIAGIVSFAVAMIGVFLMPDPWFDATTGTIIAALSSLIFFAIFIGGAYYAMVKCTDGPFWNLVGFVILLFLLWFIGYWATWTGLPPMAPLAMLIKPNWLRRDNGN